jgi:hypothetical protein
MNQRLSGPRRTQTLLNHEEPRINLWRLPSLVSVEAQLVSHPQPLVYYVGRERRETRQTVELRVVTSEPLPVRAVTPILMVGETAIPDYRSEGTNRYRFVAYEPERLAPGAAIRWGWPGLAESLVTLPFRFMLQSLPAPRTLVATRPGIEAHDAIMPVPYGDTEFHEEHTEQVPSRFRVSFYDQETLHYLDGWTRATGPSAVFLIDRSGYDSIRADGDKRGKALNQYLAQMLASQGRGDLETIRERHSRSKSLLYSGLA